MFSVGAYFFRDPIFGEDLGEANRDYIMKLSGYGFERLEKEPEHLNHENSKIQRKIEQLAVSNYRIFLETSSCVVDTRKSV